MKYKLLAAAVALASLPAHALDGSVVDDRGSPIAGASIEIEGSKKFIVSDAQGRFSLADDVQEIHITAPGFSHRMVHLDDQTRATLVIALAKTVIEQVDVIGLPIHASAIESAIPVAVLSGEALRNQQAATLGDTLARVPGVNTNFHGNVASTPVVRGLSGPRVLITQNSLDVSDVSRVGPDHSVAAEVSTAQQVEILRGPATLFYGSGAIGGVVNVVDNRVPTDSETRGAVLLSRESVNNQNLASFNVTTGTDQFAFYGDGFWREADDYTVPAAPEQGHEADQHSGDFTVANSAEESSGYTLGSSYLMANGYVGLSYGRLDREYGIPGHSHGGHEEEAAEPERVYADLGQNRYQLLSELDVDLPWLRAIQARAAYTDYTHAEVEEGIVGTTFSNETSELRVDLFHQEWAHWKGGINFHYKRSEVAAEGEEAFTPPSTSETFAMALMEEKHFGDVLVQMGARIEQVTIAADNVLLPHLAVHDHGSPDTGEDSHADEATRVFAVEHDFTPVSFSLGAVWDFSPGYNLGIALSHAQRAPSASELLSFGPHIGTRSYEIGALFAVHEEEGEAHFELSDSDVALETSNNVDLTFRKYEGDIGIILNAFYNQIDNYYYQSATGLYAEGGHDHGDEHNHGDAAEDEHADELPVYLYSYADANFYGFEAQGIWQFSERWKATLFTDYVRAALTDGTDLPRTPPLRFGADLDYTGERLSANLNWTQYAEQSKTAPLETPTNGYDMLDASVTYHLPVGANTLALFLKAENITDTEARVHTSFIKDIAPMPGRNFSVGVRAIF
ncbi:TonB-dependent receptor [Simiduia curdlanivorans]|uniref:TonB-dependent receptor n=1 Tax=Simiduia curdlanivorans TaxID=1492769 RepID=A0ABV8VB90_9GAMM|nr:TonB-dependent receptor [Simiduia curdlanivorans]MDN3639328.1 TonB-dependent receptor [Simiduia curdlanivorans]